LRKRSGKHADLLRKREKLESKIKEKIIEHRRADRGVESEDTQHAQQIERLAKHASFWHIRTFIGSLKVLFALLDFNERPNTTYRPADLPSL